MQKSRKTTINGIKTTLIDNGTGEKIFEVGENSKITLEEFFNEEDNPDNPVSFMQCITYIKSFRGNGVAMNQRLTNAEIAALVFLGDFVSYGDCVLRKNGNKLGTPLSVKDLSNLIGIKYETFRKTMYSLKKNQVIGFHNTGDLDNSIKWITVNPYIYCRGGKVAPWIADFYKDTIWAKLERQQIR